MPLSALPMESIDLASDFGKVALTALFCHPPGFLQRSASCDMGSLALVGASPYARSKAAIYVPSPS